MGQCKHLRTYGTYLMSKLKTRRKRRVSSYCLLYLLLCPSYLDASSGHYWDINGSINTIISFQPCRRTTVAHAHATNAGRTSFLQINHING